MIEITGLKKRFGAFWAVDGVDLTVKEGGLFGIVGPNGAGKTLAVSLAQAALWIIILGILLLLDLIFIGFGIVISAFSETIKDANIGVTLALIITSLAFFAPVSITKKIADMSPVFLMTKLASNPVVPMDSVIVSQGIMLMFGGGFVVLGARLLDWRENLRL